jgi:hypothetical protein
MVVKVLQEQLEPLRGVPDHLGYGLRRMHDEVGLVSSCIRYRRRDDTADDNTRDDRHPAGDTK